MVLLARHWKKYTHYKRNLIVLVGKHYDNLEGNHKIIKHFQKVIPLLEIQSKKIILKGVGYW